MPRQLLFIHSAGIQNEEQGSGFLLQHLRDGLGSAYEITAPAMPDPDNPRYRPWENHLKDLLASFAGPLVLAGHSLGGSVLLKYLSEHEVRNRIEGLFVISAPYWGAQEWDFEEYKPRPGYAAKLPEISPLVLYHSRDDEDVPFEHLALYAADLPTATIRELSGCGHEHRPGADAIVKDLLGLTSGA